MVRNHALHIVCTCNGQLTSYKPDTTSNEQYSQYNYCDINIALFVHIQHEQQHDNNHRPGHDEGHEEAGFTEPEMIDDLVRVRIH